MAHSNGVVNEILDRSRERVADGTATDNDRLITAMEALSERNQREMQKLAEHNNEQVQKAIEAPMVIRMFGRNWSATELVFLFGVTLAGETSLAIVLPQLLGG